MMHLARTVGYGVQALSCLEQAQGHPVLIRDLARQTAIKKPYLAKIINQMVHHGLVAARRGRHGGIVLARPAREILLAQVAEALEGNGWTQACFFGLQNCPCQGACPAHNQWVRLRGRMETILRETTVAEVAKVVRSDPAWAQKCWPALGNTEAETALLPARRPVRSGARTCPPSA
jgi:Rrf2 family protein